MKKLKIDRVLAAKLLTGAACVGVAFTTYLAVKRGSKVMDKIDEVKAELSEEGENKSKSKLEVAARYIARVAPVLGPVVVSGGITEACIIGAQVLSLTEIAMLSGTVGYLIANRKELEEAINELPGGKEALEKVKSKVAIATAEKAIEEDEKKKPWTHQSIEETGLGDKLCMDLWSGRLFRCDPDAVLKAWEEFNTERDEGEELPFSDGHDENFPLALSYNDIYTKVNLEPIGLYYQYGYPANDDYYPSRIVPVEIEHLKLEDMDELKKAKYGEDLYILKYPTEYSPVECWLEV